MLVLVSENETKLGMLFGVFFDKGVGSRIVRASHCCECCVDCFISNPVVGYVCFTHDIVSELSEQQRAERVELSVAQLRAVAMTAEGQKFWNQMPPKPQYVSDTATLRLMPSVLHQWQ